MKEQLNIQKQAIIKLLTEKSVMKQIVYANTIKVFEMMKEESKTLTKEYINDIKEADKRVTLDFKEFNQQSFQIKVAGDMLQFDMHTNVFDFDKSHPLFKTSYIKENANNSFCGIISVYNFLADSFKFNRLNDVGFLVARIFVNREMKFFVETKTSLNFRYNQYSNEEISNNNIKDILQELMIFSIQFDLHTPQYEHVKQISVAEIQEKASSPILKTGKRLGYIGGSSSDSYFDDDLNL